MTLTSTETLILGIVQEAKELGVAPLLRTALHKFVYLADLYAAEATAGVTHTGEPWRFHHFGPYADGVAQAMDSLAANRYLFVQRQERDDGVEFELYSPMGSAQQRLRDIGLPQGVAIRLDTDLGRYARNLSGLLEYVYFGTSPMADVMPGQALRFDACERVSGNIFKPIDIAPKTPKQLKKTRQRLSEILAARRALSSVEINTGPYDVAYYDALAIMDGDPLSTGLKGIARISQD